MAEGMHNLCGLLYSQIGYEASQGLRVVYRASDAGGLSPASRIRILSPEGQVLSETPLERWGACWQSHWWRCDQALPEIPRFRVQVLDRESLRAESALINQGPDLLWTRTWRTVSIEQLAQRAALVPAGWQDCGSNVRDPSQTLREVTSHVAMLLGLCDALDLRRFAPADAAALRAQLRIGSDYLMQCQEAGSGGALYHEMRCRLYPVPAEMPKASLAFSRCAHHLGPHLIDRAEAALCWWRDQRRVLRLESEPWAMDSAAAFTVPDEPPTCDLLMAAWAAWELAAHGREAWRAQASLWMDAVLARQVPASTEGWYGYFRAFDSLPISEKAWSHSGFGFNCGLVFPHYLIPLIRLIEDPQFSHAQERYRQALTDFCTGYLLPMCQDNPFGIIANGLFAGEGLLYFSGLGHGMNAAYAYAASLALEAARVLPALADDLRTCALANLQWIAGLNSGLSADMMSRHLGCSVYHRTMPADSALPVSMIRGIGQDWAGSWLAIDGSICNGFCADRQFAFPQAPRAATDAPCALSDEDWITHAGAWLSATARLAPRT